MSATATTTEMQSATEYFQQIDDNFTTFSGIYYKYYYHLPEEHIHLLNEAQYREFIDSLNNLMNISKEVMVEYFQQTDYHNIYEKNNKAHLHQILWSVKYLIDLMTNKITYVDLQYTIQEKSGSFEEEECYRTQYNDMLQIHDFKKEYFVEKIGSIDNLMTFVLFVAENMTPRNIFLGMCLRSCEAVDETTEYDAQKLIGFVLHLGCSSQFIVSLLRIMYNKIQYSHEMKLDKYDKDSFTYEQYKNLQEVLKWVMYYCSYKILNNELYLANPDALLNTIVNCMYT